MTALSCTDLTKTYHSRQGDVRALDGVNFSVDEGEFICLVGPNGCGKTTLLKLIAGLNQPTSGTISINHSEADSHLPAVMVFQEHGLFPWMTVEANVAFGLEMQGVSTRHAQDRARTLVEQLGLGEFARSYPHQLSGGMRQLAALGRAFLADASLLLMDEPFRSLDAQVRYLLQEELLRLWQSHNKVILYVTHDISEAVLLSDRILVMSGRPGHIREQIRIPFQRPRQLRGRDASAAAEIEAQIWSIMEKDIRLNLKGSR